MMLLIFNNNRVFVITKSNEYMNKYLLFDAFSGITYVAANDRKCSEFVKLKTSECLKEFATFSPEFGKNNGNEFGRNLV